MMANTFVFFGTNWTKRATVCFYVFIIMLALDVNAAKYKKYYMDKLCEQGKENEIELKGTGKESAMVLEYTKHSRTSRQARSCSLKIKGPSSDYDIVISIREVKMRTGFIIKTCDGSALKVQTLPDKSTEYCSIPKDNLEKTSQWTQGRQSYAMISVDHEARSITESSREFELIATAAKRGGKCGPDQFKCANNLCIAKELTCDIHNNCGDRSDEVTNCGLSAGTIISILIVIGLIVGIAIAVTLYIKRRRRGTSTAMVVTTTAEAAPLAPTGQLPYQQSGPQLYPSAYPPGGPQPYPSAYPPGGPQPYPSAYPPNGPPPPGMYVPSPSGPQPYPTQVPYNPSGPDGYGAATMAPPPGDYPGGPPPYPTQGGYPSQYAPPPQ